MARTAHSREETGEGDHLGQEGGYRGAGRDQLRDGFPPDPGEEVLETVKGKPDGLELILRGRGAPEEIIEAADHVTEMREVRQYYAKCVDVRVGVER